MAIEFEDEIIEFGERGFGDDGRGDAFDIAMRAVAQLFNLFFGVNLGKFVKVELGGTALTVRKNINFGELGFELTEGTNRNDPIA